MAFDLREQAWGEVRITLFGALLTLNRGFKYDSSQETSHLHAMGNQPISVQTGNKTYTGEVKILKSQYDALLSKARAMGYFDVSDLPPTDILVVYLPKGDKQMLTDKLEGVQFEKAEVGADQGAQYIDITLPFKFLGIKPVS